MHRLTQDLELPTSSHYGASTTRVGGMSASDRSEPPRKHVDSQDTRGVFGTVLR